MHVEARMDSHHRDLVNQAEPLSIRLNQVSDQVWALPKWVGQSGFNFLQTGVALISCRQGDWEG